MLIKRLFTLPPALLSLGFAFHVSGEEQELEWPYNLPAHMKYYPEDEARVQRNLQIHNKLLLQAPVGIRKMSGDPGEKFMMDFWQFQDQEDGERSQTQYTSGNATGCTKLIAPLQRHGRQRSNVPIIRRIMGTRALDKRAYECPAGSYSCSSIGRSDSCCGDGSTCQLVQDVGLGDVGCCPGTQVCGGSVSGCPSGGYTPCPQNPGGGCCLPGYACDGVGCIQVSTAIVVLTPTPSSTSAASSSSSPSFSSRSSASTTTVIVAPVPTPTSSTEVPSSSAVTTPPPPSSTSSRPANTLICSSGFRSCPVSLGGGCCPTDRACGRDVCPEMSSTNSFSAPGRPTGTSEVTTPVSTSSATSTVSVPAPSCPTGFYACSAYYQGGCCQTGRNCDTTSCPAGASITVVGGGGGNSISVVAPTGSGVSSVQTLLTGSCAGGWTTCGASVGGGCCPSGYECGMVCTATAPNGYNATIGKIAPNDGVGIGHRTDSLLALVVMSFVMFGFAF